MTTRIDWESPLFWKALARAAGLLSASIGALALLGWLVGTAELKSIDPGWVAMKANTALAFVLSGMALWLKASEPSPRSPRRRTLEHLLAGTVVLLALFTLLEYLAGIDFGIDQWLFEEAPGAIGSLPPGRMAPATTVCFILLGSAILLPEEPTRNRTFSATLTVTAAFIALLSGLIYLFDTDSSYGLEYSVQLAANTILALSLLAAGLLCASPEHGVVAILRRRDSGGAFARRLLPVTLLLPILLGWAKLIGERQGLLKPDFGVALMASINTITLSTLLLWSAYVLSRRDTERERMNAVIASDEIQLRTLLNTIPDLIWLKDINGVYLTCNPAFEHFFGATKAAIVGKTDYDFVPRELADFFRANDQAAITAGKPTTNEEWLTLADSGQRILAETTKMPMIDTQGKLIGVLGIARDITAHFRFTEQLHASKLETERLLAESNRARLALLSVLEDSQTATRALHQSDSALVEAQRIAKIGNWRWDMVADKHIWSEEIFRIYGRDPALGPADFNEVPKYFTAETWVQLNAAIEAALKLGAPYECDAEVVRPEGSHYWITARGKAVYDANGHMTGLVGTVQDITERKLAEEKLKKLNEYLEQRVQERTARLEASNKELEAFSYSVSHDLRAPLRSIAGFVELLRKQGYECVDDKGRHYMDVISESALQMGRLIDDILTFSRIGRVEMTLSHVNLNQVLSEVQNTLHPQTEGRRIEWNIAQLPEVNGERTMLSLVLLNLISNALKFTQTRDVAKIEVGTITGNPDETVCFVRDNGVGFDMQYQNKLFGLFQRLHSQNEFEGSGVGLANVQRIIQRHGGRVWAEGKVNAGATFYFALPAKGG